MSDEYDHDRQSAATDEANSLMEAEQARLREAVAQRRGRLPGVDRPDDVGTVENPEVQVPTPQPTPPEGPTR